MNKVMSLHDAVAQYVQSGDTICFGGFTTNRKPYAAVAEILRQGQKDFTVWAGPASRPTSTATPPTPVTPTFPAVSVPPLRPAS